MSEHKDFNMDAELANMFEDCAVFQPSKKLDGQVAIPFYWAKGSIPLYFILGANGAGKSMFRRMLSLYMKRETGLKEVIHVSMEQRTGGGVRAAMMFGDETWESTGTISAHAVKTGISTSTKREHDHALLWDEPDLGMSDEAAAGAALMIAEFVRNLPSHNKGVFITTHSRVLVSMLAENAHYIHLGLSPDTAPRTLQDWLNRPIVPCLPEDIAKASHQRFLLITKLLKG